MASRGVNKVILIGSLGGDPEIRYLPNGNAVCNVSLATSETWKDKQTGQQQERTEWHRVVFFGRIAEVVNEYANKGSKLYVEGKLQTREWEKDGQKRYVTEVVVDMGGQMQLLDGNRQQNNQQNGNQAPQSQQGNQNGGQQRQQSRPQGQQQQQQQRRPQGQQQPGYGQQRQAPNQGNQDNGNGQYHDNSGHGHGHDGQDGGYFDDDIPFAKLPSTYVI